MTSDFRVPSPADVKAEAWDGLAVRHPCHTVFLERSWFDCWRKHLAGKGGIKLATLGDGSGLHGLAALASRWFSMRGIPLMRVMGFCGSLGTTYRDFLYRPEHAEEDEAGLMDGISGQKWSLLQLWNFRGDSPTPEIIKSWCRRRGYPVSEPEGIAAPYIALPGSYGEYLATLKQSARHNLARRKNKLLRERKAGFRVDRSPSPESGESFMDMHQRKWNSQGQPGVFDKPGVRGFYREMMGQLSQQGRLWMYSIEAGGKTIAMSAKFLYGKTAHSFLGGWDPDFRDYGPGNLIEAYAIEDAVGQGMKEFDFSIGDYPYKYEFGCAPRRNRNLMVYRSGVIRRLHLLLEKLSAKKGDA
jgi:hypothetical protein